MLKKVMIIADDSELLDELKEILSMNGYTVETSSNDQLVIENIRKSKPELIVLDLNVKNGNSFHILENIKNDTDTKNIPTVLLSNSCCDEIEYKKFNDYNNIKTFVLNPTNLNFFLSELEKIK